MLHQICLFLFITVFINSSFGRTKKPRTSLEGIVMKMTQNYLQEKQTYGEAIRGFSKADQNFLEENYSAALKLQPKVRFLKIAPMGPEEHGGGPAIGSLNAHSFQDPRGGIPIGGGGPAKIAPMGPEEHGGGPAIGSLNAHSFQDPRGGIPIGGGGPAKIAPMGLEEHGGGPAIGSLNAHSLQPEPMGPASPRPDRRLVPKRPAPNDIGSLVVHAGFDIYIQLVDGKNKKFMINNKPYTHLPHLEIGQNIHRIAALLRDGKSKRSPIFTMTNLLIPSANATSASLVIMGASVVFVTIQIAMASWNQHKDQQKLKREMGQSKREMEQRKREMEQRKREMEQISVSMATLNKYYNDLKKQEANLTHQE